MALDLSTLPLPPKTSLHTLQMAGLPVDVYGLSDLPPTATHVSCLWLHHPRTRSKEYMADVAARCVGGWNARLLRDGKGGVDGAVDGEVGDGVGSGGGGEKRGLIALAYDQRNHGGRVVDEKANGSWREGNEMHAVDMFGVVQGMVSDQRGLL